jgi:RimJ/RimL family protein N-acetyltransferase
MKVVSYPEVTEFWAVAGPLLAADPVRNTFALSLVGRLANGVTPSVDTILLTVHDDRDDVIGAALRVPPGGLHTAAVPPAAAGAVVDHLLAAGHRVSGATGDRPSAEAFATAWSNRTGDDVIVVMNQRLFRLDHLSPPPNVPGEPAVATEDDVRLLADWRIAFGTEALAHHTAGRTTDEMTDQVLATFAMGHGQLLWCLAGRPVAMAVVGVPRERTSRIGPVYTPPRYRGRGFGSAVTAAAARWALDRGAEHVVLFTDLANPVANAIYQRIGFRPVVDAVDLTFRPIRLP